MKFTLVAAFALLLCAVSLEARRNGSGKNSTRNSTSRNEVRKKPSFKGYKKKNPFPLFKSCEAFNRGYAMTLKEMKKNKEIWFKNCEEEDLEVST
ncbi:hypothetical protein CDAR_542081 [Caerostris darwini]|uniref:Uncharacterized protein n=1 Tax=Caerostris darwini TaxID=1538125 RepID=A0AAV4W3C2_9ARAC|nr:hypothetical protein CDAR_542081 [Caerostris darwini]